MLRGTSYDRGAAGQGMCLKVQGGVPLLYSMQWPLCRRVVVTACCTEHCLPHFASPLPHLAAAHRKVLLTLHTCRTSMSQVCL